MITSDVNFMTLHKEGLFDLLFFTACMMEKAAADSTQADWRRLQFGLCLTRWKCSSPSGITLTRTKFIVGIFWNLWCWSKQLNWALIIKWSLQRGGGGQNIDESQSKESRQRPAESRNTNYAGQHSLVIPTADWMQASADVVSLREYKMWNSCVDMKSLFLCDWSLCFAVRRFKLSPTPKRQQPRNRAQASSLQKLIPRPTVLKSCHFNAWS